MRVCVSVQVKQGAGERGWGGRGEGRGRGKGWNPRRPNLTRIQILQCHFITELILILQGTQKEKHFLDRHKHLNSFMYPKTYTIRVLCQCECSVWAYIKQNLKLKAKVMYNEQHYAPQDIQVITHTVLQTV